MNDMTDAQISKALALAIGWETLPLDFDASDGVWVVDHHAKADRFFDYRDPAVIWPIAERFDYFPRKDQYQWWFAGKYPYTYAETAAKAVALAVIAAHGG